MLTPKHSLCITLAALALASCQPQYYKPNRVNAPLLTNAGQAEIFAGSNNLQAGYSPYKHLGIIGGYSGFRREVDGGLNERANLLEIGAGYYGRLDTQSLDRGVHFMYDVYTGVGTGTIRIRNDNKFEWPSMNLTRAFIQPGIGMRSRIFEAGFNVRLCNVTYDNFNMMPRLETPLPGRSYLFAEPAFTLRAGYKAFKFELQYVSAFPLGYIPWNYENNALNAGVSVLIGGYRK